MTITESLVSSFILVSLTVQSGQLFGDSMVALGKSRLRDGVNAAINHDLEHVRQTVASWKEDSSMATNGQLDYQPDLIHCKNATLGIALLNDHPTSLSASSTVDLSQSQTPLQGLSVKRVIRTVDGNENLIQVYYRTTGSNTVRTQISTTLSIPAQGWCPS